MSSVVMEKIALRGLAILPWNRFRDSHAPDTGNEYDQTSLDRLKHALFTFFFVVWTALMATKTARRRKATWIQDRKRISEADQNNNRKPAGLSWTAAFWRSVSSLQNKTKSSMQHLFTFLQVPQQPPLEEDESTTLKPVIPGNTSVKPSTTTPSIPSEPT